MIAQSQPGASALRHAERQQVEFRIKECNLLLLRTVKERMELVKRRNALNGFVEEPSEEPSEPEPEIETPSPPRQRRIGSSKFTDEVCERIKAMVAAGHDRETIAAMVGCSVGSLQVSCCKRKISLRVKRRTFTHA
jgi:hypothetical protein